MQLFWFAFSIAVYFALHSLLADEWVKKQLTGWLPPRFYRLGYNFFSLVTILPLAYFYLQLEKHFLMNTSPWLTGAGSFVVLAGIIWMWKSMGGYDLAEFTGLYQWKNGREPVHTVLNVSGLNGVIRHPLYFGTLLIAWGIFLAWPTDAVLVGALSTSAYLFIGSRLEERKLMQQFGETYHSYRQQVPMLLPFRWRRKKNR